MSPSPSFGLFVGRDDMSGMDMSMDMNNNNKNVSSSNETMTMPSMSPYFHTTTSSSSSSSSSSSLWLQQIAPSTPGTIFAACVALVLLSIAHRLLGAMERLLIKSWDVQARKYAKRQSRRRGGRSESGRKDGGSLPLGRGEEGDVVQAFPSTIQEEREGQREVSPGGIRMGFLLPQRRSRRRSNPAWYTRIDVPRGMFQVLYTGVGYLLMLAVMTYNLYYFISILLGVGIGESLFGRYGRSSSSSSNNDDDDHDGVVNEEENKNDQSFSSSSGGFRSLSGSGSPIQQQQQQHQQDDGNASGDGDGDVIGTRLDDLTSNGKKQDGS